MDGSLQQILLAIGSGSLIGCTLGLIGGGGSMMQMTFIDASRKERVTLQSD